MLNHLFVSSTDGGLYDTRKPEWSSKPLRAVFQRTFTAISNTQEFKATLRNGAYAWPGGYPMFLITTDGGCLHFDCAKDNARLICDAIRNNLRGGWQVVATDINWEDSNLYCDDCGKPIESAYAD